MESAADEGSVGTSCPSNSSAVACARFCIPDEVIIKANAQFWEQMVAMHLEPLPMASDFCAKPGDVQSAVELSGAWCGQIEVRMERGLAEEATAAMLLQAPESVTEADMLDAAREIANMIAGVLKVSLPKPCAMSLPRAGIARTGDETGWPYSGAVAFQHDAGEMMVRVAERGGDSGAY